MRIKFYSFADSLIFLASCSTFSALLTKSSFAPTFEESITPSAFVLTESIDSFTSVVTGDEA